jgi:seryl-tRNA synthetase
MLDIKWIRENSGILDKSLQNRNHEPMADEILAIDAEKRSVMNEVQTKQARRNEVASLIAKAKKEKSDSSSLEQESSEIKKSLQELTVKEEELTSKLNNILSTLPNIPLDDVPVGKDETANVCVRVVGEPRKFDFTPKPHYDLGEGLGMMDFENASKISGSRFTIMYDGLARLERALHSFMIDTHVKEFGYKEVMVPFLVKSESMFGTGQLPKFKEDAFCTTDERWLIPTAEVPLTNIVRDEIVPVEKLPMRITAYSACFRSEAGSAGRDTRGMIRNHQFTKVELVSIVHPDEGEKELERMTSAAENILKKLGLAYRVMLLSSGDMGFSARKTYDLEVWIPSESTYREISSCSLCGQFQARRMNARYKGNGEKGYVATLNGSGLAIGRTMVAILENYQDENGNIRIPEVLVPYMNGITELKNGN